MPFGRVDLRVLVVAIALAAAVILIASAVNAPRAQAGCGSVTLGGKSFVFLKGGIKCHKGKALARYTYNHNKAPAGWKCPDASPGNNRRDGANCQKVGNPNKYYHYHVAD